VNSELLTLLFQINYVGSGTKLGQDNMMYLPVPLIFFRLSGYCLPCTPQWIYLHVPTYFRARHRYVYVFICTTHTIIFQSIVYYYTLHFERMFTTLKWNPTTIYGLSILDRILYVIWSPVSILWHILWRMIACLPI